MYRVSGVAISLFASVSVFAGVAAAQDSTPKSYSPWALEVGARYWYSSGTTRYDLFDSTGALLISRLTYEDLTASSGEAFFRLDHLSTGLFLKGYVGGGKVGSGNLIDEDFPPVTTPYSKTISSQDDGTLRYFSVDLGYNFIDATKSGLGMPFRLGGFVGFHYLKEQLDAFGCTQRATSSICVAVPVAPSTLVISQESEWRSLRLGVIGEVSLTRRLKLSGEAAYVRTWLDGADTHHLRIGVPTPGNQLFNGPTPEDGDGDGVQLEAILSYQLTDALNIGLGARYWRMQTNGLMHFEVSRAPAPASAQVLDFETDRFGVFVQGSLKLN